MKGSVDSEEKQCRVRQTQCVFYTDFCCRALTSIATMIMVTRDRNWQLVRRSSWTTRSPIRLLVQYSSEEEFATLTQLSEPAHDYAKNEETTSRKNGRSWSIARSLQPAKPFFNTSTLSPIHLRSSSSSDSIKYDSRRKKSLLPASRSFESTQSLVNPFFPKLFS